MDGQNGTQPALGDSDTSFEVALEILDGLVAYAARRISSERAEADSDAIALWEHRRDEWVRRRRELRPRDGLAVRAVLEDDGAFLRSLPTG